MYEPELLQRASLLATLAAITPPCFIIFLKPRKELLPLALASSAWGFFLFSFQVHEKSALLPLMPMTVLLASKDGLSRYARAWVGFANLLGVWTMFPLLSRVDLRVPYTVGFLLVGHGRNTKQFHRFFPFSGHICLVCHLRALTLTRV
jgi:alpha-1,3-glucosyltransferase